jgi:phytoene dehydrogenase-like protein
VQPAYDAIIVGSGPNGLAAALALAEEGLSTLVVEAHDEPGGGTRTLEMTAPGFHHDVCSTVHPLGIASPWLRALELEKHGLEWIHPRAPLAHVVGDRVVTLERSLEETCAQLGRDGNAYRDLLAPFVERFDELLRDSLAPLRPPESPLLFARFGLRALRSLEGLAGRFEDPAAPALLAGIAAHAMVPLDQLATASFGLILAAAGHAVGWPIARGGSKAITHAMVAKLRAMGGEVICGERVTSLDELPLARAYILDVTPKQLLAIAGDRLPDRYREKIADYRYGLGVFKIDWALRDAVPWRDARCARSATVHLSGTMNDVAAAEATAHAGGLAERPFILFVQPTLFDPSRAPANRHIAWAYCHVPPRWDGDATRAIEDHVEAFAPGFRDTILARNTMGPAQMEAYNANYVGGDINGGISDLRQLFFRPTPKLDPYATPARDIFLCSSSTPPGGGVHGMCGYWAARSVLRRVFDLDPPPLAHGGTS